MAMLAPTAFQQPSGAGPNMTTAMSSNSSASISMARRVPTLTATQSFNSPTNSEFSDDEDGGPESVRNWSEDKVCDYLRSVKCGEYEKLFRMNNINGENLLELDKDVLKEMGIEKVGDRVRLFLGIKKLRTKAYANHKKRNRDSFALLDPSYVPPSSYSNRPSNPSSSSSRAIPTPPSANKRISRQFENSMMLDASTMSSGSRPASPLPSAEARSKSQQQLVQQQSAGRFGQSPILSSAAFVPSRQPTSSPDGLKAQHQQHQQQSQQSQQTLPRLVMAHTRNNSSVDGSLMAALPQGQDVIRVISTGGVTKVVKIADCSTCEDVMRVTLRKFALREDHERNYCFWVLAGVDPDPAQCRRLGDTELWRIIKDQKRPERNRLILRRVPSGEPGESELHRAAGIALEEATQNHARALTAVDKRSQAKVQKVLGEKWDNELQHPISPYSFQERERNSGHTSQDFERPGTRDSMATTRTSKMMRPFGGLRPPSELITSDLTSYFPDHAREDIDRTVRLSMRRSVRLSRVNHRLSVASNLSYASTIMDAPPIPTIADAWLGSGQLAKVRSRDSAGRNQQYRDSVASSMLGTLREEGHLEPNRKSYVSFTDSASEVGVHVTDADGNKVVARTSYYDGDNSTLSTLSTLSGSGSGSGSYQDLTQALTEDGEEVDPELQSFLAGESWDDNKWMQGALIGQGSFGCVYLALHAVTGELLAVKQVESPSPGSTNSQMDNRKRSMIEALKREIGLLRELKHPNIVQYLGCSSSTEYLNIFLEYVPGGSVQTMLNSYGALPEQLVRSFVRQILTGLSYLHNMDIIHRDIKGANILVDNKGTIKISDFGISKKVETSTLLKGAANNRNRPSLQGSVFWMAPEVVKQTSYTRKADIWSLGCLVVEMMTGSHPFPDCSQLQAIFKIGGGKATPTIPDSASDEAKSFLSQTFELDHNLRPSADDLMESSFLLPPAVA